jgi:hypothetical protein
MELCFEELIRDQKVAKGGTFSSRMLESFSFKSYSINLDADYVKANIKPKYIHITQFHDSLDIVG